MTNNPALSEQEAALNEARRMANIQFLFPPWAHYTSDSTYATRTFNRWYTQVAGTVRDWTEVN